MKADELLMQYAAGERSFDYETLRYANLRYANLQYADLQGANLQGADLQVANLQDANLRYANLRYADLHGANYGEGIPLTREPRQVLGGRYPILIMDRHIQVGCLLLPLAEWRESTGEELRAHCEVSAADIEWWFRERPVVLALADIHCDADSADARGDYL